MLAQILSLLLILFGGSLGYNFYSLYKNYLQAQELGLPIVAIPISPDNPLWIALQTSFTKVLQYVPFNAFSFTRHCRLGWEFHDRYQTHVRLGDAWVLVTPAKNWLYVTNGKAVTEIFSRSRDFVRPVWMLGMLLES